MQPETDDEEEDLLKKKKISGKLLQYILVQKGKCDFVRRFLGKELFEVMVEGMYDIIN